MFYSRFVYRQEADMGVSYRRGLGVKRREILELSSCGLIFIGHLAYQRLELTHVGRFG